jgi:hypothetical protein
MRLASFAGLASMDSAAQSAEIEVTYKGNQKLSTWLTVGFTGVVKSAPLSAFCCQSPSCPRVLENLEGFQETSERGCEHRCNARIER